MDTNYVDVPTKPKNRERLVLVGGCFDILHYGHISFLTEAKKYGDHLIVLLESDETIKRLKGNNRPFHTQQQRKEMLVSIRAVDEVILLPPMSTDNDYVNIIRKIKPHIIAFTEGDPIADKKIKQAEHIGSKTVIIPKVPAVSTSNLSKLLGLE